jgi:PAS domain S-box-containing protein
MSYSKFVAMNLKSPGFPHRKWIPYFAFLVGIMFTLLICYIIQKAAETKDKQQFDETVIAATYSIDSHMDIYIAILRSVTAFFDIGQVMTKSEFTNYVSSLKLISRYPGIQGIGFSEKILPADLNREVSRLRQYWPDFHIYPDSIRPEYTSIIYLEPQNPRNRAAIGYDMFSEPVRRMAMEAARDSGQPVASGKVTLVQELDQNKQSGFLIYMPVFAGSNAKNTVEERQHSLLGYVYSPFRCGDLFGSIFSENPPKGLDFRVYDGESINQDHLLYSSDNGQTNKSVYSGTQKIYVAGRIWTLVFYTNSAFELSLGHKYIPLIFLSGLGLSLVLFTLTLNLNLARIRAERISSDLESSRESLRLNEEKYRTLVDSANDLINIIDHDGNYLYVSPSYLPILGYYPQSLIGKSIFNLVNPEDKRSLQRHLAKLNTGKSDQTRYRLRHSDGHDIWVDTLRREITDPETSKKVYMGIARDITQQIELERHKDEFIGLASHELKTPVTSLKLYAQSLYKHSISHPDPKTQDYVSKINYQIDRLIELIRNMLDVTKLEANKIQLNFEVFDINRLISETISLVQTATSKHKLVIKGKSPLPVVADRERISQVLTNLLINAVKYSPDADQIITSVQPGSKSVLISVQDFGRGIPKSDHQMIFNRFYRVDTTDSNKLPGIGLGLYISNEIIKRHKSHIKVDSTPGQGSTFSFKLQLFNSASSSRVKKNKK